METRQRYSILVKLRNKDEVVVTANLTKKEIEGTKEILATLWKDTVPLILSSEKSTYYINSDDIMVVEVKCLENE